jgi:hypothetical protein
MITPHPEADPAPFKVHLLTKAGRVMRARSEPVRASQVFKLRHMGLLRTQYLVTGTYSCGYPTKFPSPLCLMARTVQLAVGSAWTPSRKEVGSAPRRLQLPRVKNRERWGLIAGLSKNPARSRGGGGVPGALYAVTGEWRPRLRLHFGNTSLRGSVPTSDASLIAASRVRHSRGIHRCAVYSFLSPSDWICCCCSMAICSGEVPDTDNGPIAARPAPSGTRRPCARRVGIIGYVFALCRWNSATPWWISSFVPNLEAELGLALWSITASWFTSDKTCRERHAAPWLINRLDIDCGRLLRERLWKLYDEARFARSRSRQGAIDDMSS